MYNSKFYFKLVYCTQHCRMWVSLNMNAMCPELPQLVLDVD